MSSAISESSLHAFHLSRLIRSTSTSSLGPRLNDETYLIHQLDPPKPPRISEADVHAYHFAHVHHRSTSSPKKAKSRRSLPARIRSTKARPLPIRRSSSVFSTIPLSSSLHAHIPVRAHSPEKPARDSASLPHPSESDLESVPDEMEVDQLRSSPRERASSDTSASSVIPSSPMPERIKKRYNTLGMVGLAHTGYEGLRTPMSERGGSRELGSARHNRSGNGKKRMKGPSWVTETPVAR